MNPIAYRGSVDPNTLRAHHGHQFTNTVDETNLPHIAILHCATCNQELARMPLDIRVITLSSMCFGDAMQHWQNRLFIGTSSICEKEIAGDEPLIDRIDKELVYRDARADASTVMMGNPDVIEEPARIIEPISSDYASTEAYQDARTEFEALWAAITLPDKVHLALRALPLVEQAVQLQYDLRHNPSIGGEEDLAHDAYQRQGQVLEQLLALLHPELLAPEQTPTEDSWLDDIPPV